MKGDGILRTQEDIDKYWQYLTDLATASGGTPEYLGITTKDKMYPGMLAYKDIAGDIDVENKTIAGPNGRYFRDHGQDYKNWQTTEHIILTQKLNLQWGDFQLECANDFYLMGRLQGAIYHDVAQSINNSTIILVSIFVNDMFDPIDNPDGGKYPSMAVPHTYGEYSDFWMEAPYFSVLCQIHDIWLFFT